MTALVVLCGAGIGIGVWLILVGLRPRPPRLDKALAALQPITEPEPAAPTGGDGHSPGWAARLGSPVVRLLQRAGLPTARVRADLATIGKPVTVHLSEQAAAVLVGLLLPTTVGVLLAVAGMGTGLTMPLLGGLMFAATGYLALDLGVRGDAAAHRAAFTHALSSYLDLVVVAMAGGAGVDQALDDAAAVGRGPAYAELRYA
ncbi:MAG TPA: hypothetical protein VNV66_10425, partial [Pilimelia sp.]|nr:hypothetical protein [Pilimelia sp.]